MTTTLKRWFLMVTVFAGLLTASFPVPYKAEVRMQAAHQNQLVGRNEAAMKAGGRFTAPGQPPGLLARIPDWLWCWLSRTCRG